MSQVANTERSMLAGWTGGRDRRDGGFAQLAWLDDLRSAAKAAFETLGLPTTRDEAWRFTNIAPITRIPFLLAASPDRSLLASPDAAHAWQDGSLPHAHRLVFVNGHFQAALSTRGELPDGVVLTTLSAAPENTENLAQSLGRLADYSQHAFTALNTVNFPDAAVLMLAKGAVVEQPIQLLFVSVAGDQPAATYPRVLVRAEANSRATILESFISRDAEGADFVPHFTNAVTEVSVGENAIVDYCRQQDESEQAFHIGTTHVELGPGAHLDSHVMSSGGKPARHELHVVLRGEGGECNLNGLAVARRRQLVDHQTRIDHVTPRCTSREMYKAVIDDAAHGVFSGKIHVHPQAQKTDARQTNHTLLLSDDAVMDTQPQLEIYADDVKCTHGASVGSLDDQALFYLRTRGISVADARQLLTMAFVNEVLQRIPSDALRSHLESHLFSRLQLEGDTS